MLIYPYLQYRNEVLNTYKNFGCQKYHKNFISDTILFLFLPINKCYSKIKLNQLKGASQMRKGVVESCNNLDI